MPQPAGRTSSTSRWKRTTSRSAPSPAGSRSASSGATGPASGATRWSGSASTRAACGAPARPCAGSSAGASPTAAVWAALKEAYTRAILGRDDFELAADLLQLAAPAGSSRMSASTRRVDFVADDVPAALPRLGDGERPHVRRAPGGRRGGPPGAGGRRVPGALPRPRRRTPRLAAERLEAGLCGGLRRGRDRGARRAAAGLLPQQGRPTWSAGRGAARRWCRWSWRWSTATDGLEVDAVLHTEDEASIVFSFARWYFHADVASPREVIGFLRSILPRKRIAELYISLGYNKHGKTEFYRDLMRHIAAHRTTASCARPRAARAGDGGLHPALLRVRLQGDQGRASRRRRARRAARSWSRYREVLRARPGRAAGRLPGVRAPHLPARPLRRRTCSPSCCASRRADRRRSRATRWSCATSTSSAG